MRASRVVLRLGQQAAKGALEILEDPEIGELIPSRKAKRSEEGLETAQTYSTLTIS